MEQIQIRNLSFSYPDSGVDCLKDVSLSIEKGEFVLLCGTSGCGKTTLLRHLKSVLTPRGIRSGAVLFRGTPLDQVPLAEQSQAIGFVMQNPDDQIVTDKVWHELAFGLENLGVPRDVIGTRVAEMASFFGIQSWYHREVSQLSGGQKQLLNLASIMAMQPEILILDEPTGQLDPIAAGDFLNTLKKINRELGITVLITEHRAEEIFPAADRVLVMDAGRLIVDAPPREAGRILMEMGNPLEDMLPAPMRIFCKSGAEEQVIAVDVEGEVRHPGLYSLPAGSRAGDAVEAAGGLTKHARAGAVNLAQLLEDGQQVTIPSKKDAQAAVQEPAADGGAQAGPVNINSASAQELQQLSGIGELLSQRIVDYRSTHGPFASADELTEVPGIGEARLEKSIGLIPSI